VASGEWLVARKRDPRADRRATPSGTQKACSTPSFFASSSLFCLLSPIIPVHPRIVPVSLIIPVHTQKQGGVGGSSKQMIFTNAPLRLSNPGGYNRLRKERTASEGGPYTNCKPAFLTPAFTTTSIAIVGAPTFSFLCATEGEPKNRSEDRPLHWKGCGPPQKAGPYTNCRLSAMNFAPRERGTLRVQHSPCARAGYLSFAMLMRLGRVTPALRGVSTDESPTLMV
jgi:hypothetical protein